MYDNVEITLLAFVQLYLYSRWRLILLVLFQ